MTRKLAYALPNSLTLMGLFCGFYSIVHALSDQNSDVLAQSAIAIFFAGFFDLFDGRLARLTNTESKMGVQLDSLADMVSFGVAPAVLIYKWALWPLGALGMVGAFIYASCGALRLARFNVMTESDKGSSSHHFVGLPIPLAAAALVCMVLSHLQIYEGISVQRHYFVLVVVLLISYLMVSRVAYWSFKKIQLNFKSTALIIGIIVLVGILGQFFPMSFVLFLFVFGYIAFGVIAGLAKFYQGQRSS